MRVVLDKLSKAFSDVTSDRNCGWKDVECYANELCLGFTHLILSTYVTALILGTVCRSPCRRWSTSWCLEQLDLSEK